MKSFIAILVIAAAVIAGYFLLHTPEAAVTPAEEASDQTPNESATIDASLKGTKELDTEKSEAKWTGSKKLIKDYYDHGTVDVKSGTAIFADGKLTGGTVTFDMTSIATASTGRGSDADTTSKMAGHLKSDAFFDTAKYPEAKFVITSTAWESAATYLVTGDLTIKSTTAPVSFPVSVTTANGIATISGTATIDRTVYDVRFGSSKFFSDLGDNVINDEFALEFKSVTKN